MMFALPISIPRFKSIIFYQNSPKIKLFLEELKNFRALGGSASQTPVPPAAGRFASTTPASGGWGLCPQAPNSLRLLGASPQTPKAAPHCDCCSQNFGANHKLKHVSKNNSANVDALPQGYLIIAKQRFALESEDAIEISYFFERLELRLQTTNHLQLF